MLLLVILLAASIPLAILYIVYRKIKQILNIEIDPKKQKAARASSIVRKAKIQQKHLASAKEKIIKNAGNVNPLLGTALGILKSLGLTDNEIMAAALDPTFQKGIVNLLNVFGGIGERVQGLLQDRGKKQKQDTQWG